MQVASPIPHKKARIEIIPLIDIMFFLLASFMMVSLSQVHMKGIKVNLPSGQSGETQTKREYLSVSVDRDGHYFFDKDEVKDEQLLNLLKMAHQSAPDARIRRRLVRHFQKVQQLLIFDFVLIKEIMAIPIDRHAEVLPFGLRLTRLTRGQIHLDSLHVHLAKAHHHETGEQKEHDVDQRDDLDPRFLMWNG